jgi:hypothetical protein
MPKLEFFASEVEWYNGEAVAATNLVNNAVKQSQNQMSFVLKKIAETHGLTSIGAQVKPIVNAQGRVIAVEWPDPPKAPAPPAGDPAKGVASAGAAPAGSPPPAAGAAAPVADPPKVLTETVTPPTA